jgi:hypothetical protein
MPRYIVCLIVVLLLVACSDPGNRTGGDPGLVRNAAFERDADGRLEGWTFVGHATTGSYRFETGDGVLRIERVGPEPWAQAVQSLDAKPLIARRLAFTAEIELSQSAEDSGIGVRVRGYKPGFPRSLGKSILLTARSEAGIAGGWQPHRVEFEVPAGATRIELSLRHAGNGVLRARNPSLRPL